jgi:hypothetical protein
MNDYGTFSIYVISQNKDGSFPQSQLMGERKDGFPMKDVGNDEVEDGLQREYTTGKWLSPTLRNCQQKICPLFPCRILSSHFCPWKE